MLDATSVIDNNNYDTNMAKKKAKSAAAPAKESAKRTKKPDYEARVGGKRVNLPPPDLTTLGGRIRAAREKAGLSGNAAAKACGINQGYLWQLENQSGLDPTLSTIVVIAETLGVDPADLIPPSPKGSRKVAKGG